ncbi:MAG: hypothetical protein P4M14_03090 [Gammaproteobacteria bacterium]|nr:hypothetical protein [Gammaproteobacteria bacterium]
MMSTTEQMIRVQAISTMPCSLLILKPNPLFKDWVSELCSRESSMASHGKVLTLDEVSQDSVVFCTPQFLEADKYQQYLKKNYKNLLNLTFSSWCSVTEWWPTIESYENFLQYFTPEFHSHVYDSFSSVDLSAVSRLLTQGAASPPEIMAKLNCMVLLLRPLREFWAWIKKVEHELPSELQAVFLKGGHIDGLDMNCNAYCIPEYTEEAAIDKFMLQMTPAFLMEELTRWGVPLEHAKTFHASALIEKYFSIDIHRVVIFIS